MSGQGYVLITRPEPDASAYAGELEALGHRCLSAPMLEYAARPFTPPDLTRYDGIIFTSAAGVRFFCKDMGGANVGEIPVHCVGAHSAAAAREAGYEDVRSADGDAKALLDMLADVGSRFLYIRGVHAARDLAQALQMEGCECDPLLVYEARKTQSIPQNVMDAIRNRAVGSAVFFSRRTAENFIALAQTYELTPCLNSIRALCISQSVVEYVHSALWAEAVCARRPDRAALNALL